MGVASAPSALARLEERAAALACHNVGAMELGAQSWLAQPRWRIALLGAGVALLAGLQWVFPLHDIHAQNVLHHLCFLPIVIAGLVFGWRAALIAAAIVAAVQTPFILYTWNPQRINGIDLLTELPVFAATSAVAGLMAERERSQRLKLEKTKHELEQVYQELQRNFERLKKAERLYAAGQLSAGLAHEIRNPLASISGAAGILKRGNARTEDRAECLEIIEKETQRLNQLLTRFLDFARPRPPRFLKVELAAVFDSVLALAQHADGARRVQLWQELDTNLGELECDPEQLKQVLLNLIINAIQASDDGGRVELSARRRGKGIVIQVSDQGRGIAPGDQDRIFDPFFTTKETGTGLGLAVAAKIVEQHGGTLSAEPNAGRGMVFRLELPLEAHQA